MGKKKDRYYDDEDDEGNDEEPFDDEFFDQMNDTMKDFMKNMPFKLPEGFNFNDDIFKNIFKQITDQLDINPSDLNTMSPDDIMKRIKDKKFNLKGPFMFGFNMRMGENGAPQWDQFGNIKTKTTGEGEIHNERDPLVDLYHEDEYLVVVVEVPGVTKEQIELKTSPTELEVSTKKITDDPYSRNYHKNISLPVEIDPDIAKARYKNGILEVKLKKVGEKNTKKSIDID